MKYFTKSEELNVEDKSLIAILRLLCSLEYSYASMTWYAGSIADRIDLPPNESVLALAIAISSTAEALHIFHNLEEKKIIIKNSNWSSNSKEAFDFINSDEVKDFKNKHLKLIRDKSTFHIDPQPIKNYIEKMKANNNTILTLWETEHDGKRGHSPMAAEIIGEYLLDATFSIEDSAKMATKIFGAVREIVLQCISDKLSITT